MTKPTKFYCISLNYVWMGAQDILRAAKFDDFDSIFKLSLSLILSFFNIYKTSIHFGLSTCQHTFD